MLFKKIELEFANKLLLSSVESEDPKTHDLSLIHIWRTSKKRRWEKSK